MDYTQFNSVSDTSSSDTIFIINLICYFLLMAGVVFYVIYKSEKNSAIEHKAEQLLGKEKSKELFEYRDTIKPTVHATDIIGIIFVAAISSVVLAFLEDFIARIYNSR